MVYHSVAQVPKEFKKNWESTPQTVQARVGLDTLIYDSVRINLLDLGYFDVNFLDVDWNGNLGAYDFGLERILYFPKSDYMNIKEYGDGEGRGPREFMNAYDLKFDKNQNIWLTDVGEGRISQWSKEGELLQIFPPSKKYVLPARLAVCDNNTLFVISEQYSNDGFYQHIGLDGKHLKSFKKVDNHFFQFPSYSDGELDCDQQGALYHAGIYREYIRKYDYEGNLVFSRSVVDFEPNPKDLIKEEKEGLFGKWYTRIENIRRASGDVVVQDGLIYVGFSGKKPGEAYLGMIDVYSSTDGEYKYSFTFPYRTQEFTILNDRVYTLEFDENEDLYLAVYRLPKFRLLTEGIR
ncbi:hypothetical protein SAMN06265219_11078 [Gracilimonas mengyeensis]|uniref:6-bladed beta-propeller protein n=2 Tax=Gracilimonas mengyeensis TaxID=1302730 RepID=A0A521E416_9BACT|nr:hypothetical protein SAMN06265219_11078 [Gracilimonas mengyeensis]